MSEPPPRDGAIEPEHLLPVGAPWPPGLEMVRSRPYLLRSPRPWIPLAPGDRPLVEPGGRIEQGTPLAERHRDVALESVAWAEIAAADRSIPGGWFVAGAAGGRRRRRLEGELLYRDGDHWRIAVGKEPETLTSPVGGVVRSVVPGAGISIDAGGLAIAGVRALGDMGRGRLIVSASSEGEQRAVFEVGHAGAIVVTGARVDAEALTRARAMGLRGLVVPGLTDRDQRDFVASETRQRAGMAGLAPFGVIVLDGFVRRPLTSPARAAFNAIAGQEVALIISPPLLVFDPPPSPIPSPPLGLVRIRHGPGAGREGRWAGPAGRRRFAGGLELEAGLVTFDADDPVVVALGDLERFIG